MQTASHTHRVVCPENSSVIPPLKSQTILLYNPSNDM